MEELPLFDVEIYTESHFTPEARLTHLRMKCISIFTKMNLCEIINFKLECEYRLQPILKNHHRKSH